MFSSARCSLSFSLFLTLASLPAFTPHYSDPPWHFVFGVFGFLLAAAGLVYAKRCFLPAYPKGLADLFPWCRSLHGLIARATTFAAFGAGITIPTLFISARLDGVCNGQTPVFAPRSKYVLTNHGKQTEVSKLRYWTVGTSFSVGWHSMVLIFSLSAMRALMFGERLNEPKMQNDNTRNA